jgi:hypothetical protein
VGNCDETSLRAALLPLVHTEPTRHAGRRASTVHTNRLHSGSRNKISIVRSRGATRECVRSVNAVSCVQSKSVTVYLIKQQQQYHHLVTRFS